MQQNYSSAEQMKKTKQNKKWKEKTMHILMITIECTVEKGK